MIFPGPKLHSVPLSWCKAGLKSLAKWASQMCMWRSRWGGCGALLSQKGQGAGVSVLGTHPCLRHQRAGAGSCHICGITLVTGNLYVNPHFLIFFFLFLFIPQDHIRKKEVSVPGQIKSSPSLVTAVSKWHSAAAVWQTAGQVCSGISSEYSPSLQPFSDNGLQSEESLRQFCDSAEFQ